MSHASVEAGSASDRQSVTGFVKLPGTIERALSAYRKAQWTYGKACASGGDGDMPDACAEWQALRHSIAAALARSPAPAVPESVRRLSEAATGGVWSAGDDATNGMAQHVYANEPVARPLAIATFGREHPRLSVETRCANAHFVAAAVNFVRTLLASDPPSGRAGEETAPAPDGAGMVPEGWRKALRDLIDEHDKNVCHHEETHRGGAIWTICDHCGRKWADDEGGFQPYEEPAAVTAAWALLKCEEIAAPEPAPAPAPAHGSAESGWHRPDEQPEIGRRYVQLYEDGSGAALLYRHDGGTLDCEGDEYQPHRSLKPGPWSYAPAGFRFWCEDHGDGVFELDATQPATPAEGR